MFGPYRIEEELGGGRTGEVHRAYDTHTQRTVALKRLRTGLPDEQELRTRFARESRIVAGLTSPYLIPIHDVGEIDGRLYIDMQLVRGRDLGTVLVGSGPWEPARVAAVVGQVAGALHVAHENGLVHRDVKPSNVVLDEQGPDGFAYLVDFGIATTATPVPGALADNPLGESAYMPPEMFYDVAVDRRADVYALACFAFELLTGRPPFGVHGSGAMHEHLNMPPPRLSHARPGLPVQLDDVLVRGMAKRPDDRFPTAPAFAAAVSRALTPPPAQAPREVVPTADPVDRRRRSRAALVGVLVAVAAVALLLFVVLGIDRGSSAGPTTSSATDGPVSAETGAGRNDPASLAAVRAVFPRAGEAGCDVVPAYSGRYVPLASIGCRTGRAIVYYQVWSDVGTARKSFEAYRLGLVPGEPTKQWFVAGSRTPQGPYVAAPYGDDHVVIALYRDRRYSIFVAAETPEEAASTFSGVAARTVDQVPR